jgi:hypothetical protein
MLEKAHTLDDLIVVHDEEQLRKILFGSTGKHTEAAEAAEEAEQPRRSLRDQSAKPAEEAPVSSLRSKPRLTPVAETAKDKCEFGAQFGVDYGKYGECEKCEKAQPCAEAADRADSAKKTEPVKEASQPAATTGRRTLLRRGQ